MSDLESMNLTYYKSRGVKRKIHFPADFRPRS